MTTPSVPPATGHPRDEAHWAGSVGKLKVGTVPQGAVNLNVDGRRPTSPLQGFGRLWQKTYRVRIPAEIASPTQVVEVWKANLPKFQPPQNRFFPAAAGVAPGEVVLINASMQGMPVDTGVMVLYADDESFTLMTPEGHPEAGWITFSAYSDGAHTVCQIQSMARAADPVYEIGFRLIGAKAQEKIWHHVLHSLAGYYGVTGVAVHMQKTCVDPRVQWAAVRNVWHNAGMRSMIYVMGRPVRQLRARPRR
jgi:hypothetical protein